MMDYLKDKLRAWEFAALALVAVALVVLLAPHRVASLLGMAAQMTVAAYLGYWVDRVAFKYARPHTLPPGDAFNTATMRRAVIVGAALVAAGFSL